MENEIANVLRDLADKLGTTTEYLWSVMVKQAGVSAAMDIIWFVLVIILCVFYFQVYSRLRSKFDESEGACWIAAALGIFSAGAILFWAFNALPDLITALFNPEYWALQQILDKL